MADEPIKRMLQMIPREWDKAPVSIALEIRGFLEAVKDADTHIDTGTNGETGDLWITIQGVEYLISVRKSARQLKLETEDGRKPQR